MVTLGMKRSEPEESNPLLTPQSRSQIRVMPKGFRVCVPRVRPPAPRCIDEPPWRLTSAALSLTCRHTTGFTGSQTSSIDRSCPVAKIAVAGARTGRGREGVDVRLRRRDPRSRHRYAGRWSLLQPQNVHEMDDRTCTCVLGMPSWPRGVPRFAANLRGHLIRRILLSRGLTWISCGLGARQVLPALVLGSLASDVRALVVVQNSQLRRSTDFCGSMGKDLRYAWPSYKGVVSLTGVELVGAEERDAAKKVRRVAKGLTAEEWVTVSEAVKAIDFWNMPSRNPEGGGHDGEEWIIEGRRGRRYHAVHRWSPGAGPIQRWLYLPQWAGFKY